MPKSGSRKSSERTEAGKGSGAGPDAFVPFADDAAVRTIGDLAIENGTDRIALHGSLDIARDKAGLDRARALAATLAAIVAALEGAPLPDAVAETVRPTETVKNPFA
ncbi:hypothetical protein [Methylobacterium goesingense]|uniref:Uncharacterized protein n=1 Tax=Methylobacterium goesingense TaxID=243690 RepID=A0ABV2LCN2_9HYPH|nr:hypothetical protein [Methylobacterium goesingense]GJD75494.1 hypothetical protein CFIICLFH_3735 [Methylobacterium goesingense]